MERFLLKAYKEFKKQHPGTTASLEDFRSMCWAYGSIEIEKMSLKDFEQKLGELKAKNIMPTIVEAPQPSTLTPTLPERLEPQISNMAPKKLKIETGLGGS